MKSLWSSSSPPSDSPVSATGGFQWRKVSSVRSDSPHPTTAPTTAPVEPPSTATAASAGYRRLELAVQAFFFILAIVTALNSLELGLTVSFGPGPGFFPFYLSIAMGVLVLAWIVQSQRAVRSGADGHTAIDDAVDYRHVATVIVSLIVLAAVMGILGYQIAMFLFLYFHLAVRAKRTWYTSLIIAAGGSVGVFHIFTDLLSVALPVSTFGFLNTIGF